MVAHRWPAGSVFRKLILEPSDEERPCGVCARPMRICDHRHRRLYLFGGPLQVTCKLMHCGDPSCPGARRTYSPGAELGLAPPRWLIDWEVFAWLGQRRAERKQSVAQLRADLAAEHSIGLSDDALAYYVARYAELVEQPRTDPEPLREAYRDVPTLALSLDAVQPERGRPALAVVREVHARRVWFAAPLTPGGSGDVARLLTRARDLAAALDRPIAAWTTARHDALTAGLAAVFPGVPRRAAEPAVPRARVLTWRPAAASRAPSRCPSVAPACPPRSWHPPPQSRCPTLSIWPTASRPR